MTIFISPYKNVRMSCSRVRSASPRCVPWDRGRGLNSTEQEGNDTPTVTPSYFTLYNLYNYRHLCTGIQRKRCAFLCVQSFFSACDSAPWFRSSHLDYLSLDFNSASPSPVQKVSMSITPGQGKEEIQHTNSDCRWIKWDTGYFH